MSKDTPKKVDTNKTKTNTAPSQLREREHFFIEITDKEKTYFERLASLLSKVQLPDSPVKLIPDKTLSSLGRMGLGMVTHVYLTQVLIQSELAKTLPDKEALNEFVAFRRDYMNFPVDKQITDLKRVGIVK
jgi:hypothetical protein